MSLGSPGLGIGPGSSRSLATVTVLCLSPPELTVEEPLRVSNLEIGHGVQNQQFSFHCGAFLFSGDNHQ